MITGDIKQKVDDVWQTFWNNGFTQPSAIFEQINYQCEFGINDDFFLCGIICGGGGGRRGFRLGFRGGGVWWRRCRGERRWRCAPRG